MKTRLSLNSIQNGYALILFLILLPLLLSLFLGFIGFSAVFIGVSKMENLCYRTQLELQIESQKALYQLLSWNPKSTHLRKAKRKAQHQLQQALMANNLEFIEFSKRKLEKINYQQILLDQKQKNVITHVDKNLKKGSSALQKRLELMVQQDLAVLNPWLQFSIQFNPPQRANFDVQLQDSDLAPNYNPSMTFQKKQIMAQTWQGQIAVNAKYQIFSDLKFKIQRSCQTTLVQKGSEWIPVIL